MARAPRVLGVAFLLVGIGLLGGAAFWYYMVVVRPQSWPRAEAEVISSRVINPSGPDSYSPEITLRYEAGAGVRQPVIAASWSTSSYDAVRGHVDRYPAGSRVTVAVNPDDPDDARYEIGATLVNLLGPGILTFMGLVFGTVGLVVAGFRAREHHVRLPTSPEALREHGRVAAAQSARVVSRAAMLFLAIGVFVIGLGIVLARIDFDATRNWPTVNGTVVASRLVSTRSTSTGNRPSQPMFDLQVTFRYEVDDKPYESTTASGTSTSDRSDVEESARTTYAAGTTHTLRIMPTDPNIIRFDATSPFRVFFLSGGMIAMGLIFLAFGVFMLRSARHTPPPVPAFERVDPEDRFRPRV